MALGAGDVVWVILDPVLGTEQAGRRPALVVSEESYNERSTRGVVCPITSRQRDWPFEVLLPEEMSTRGVVLVDQVRTLPRPTRLLDVIERAPPRLLDDVRDKLAALLGLTGGDRSHHD